jgi:hypothetical protein
MRFIVAIGVFIMVISSVLMYSALQKLKVRTKGTIVKAHLIKKGTYATKGGSMCYFLYNSQTFSDKLGTETYSRAKVNDTFAFYYLEDEPNLFVNAINRIEGIYFDIGTSILLFAFGVFFIVYFATNNRKIGEVTHIRQRPKKISRTNS